jgi:hypothetical protein
MKNLKALKQQTTDMEAKLKEMKAEIERMENGWEMKCPYREGDKYFLIYETGSLIESRWDGRDIDKDRFSQGSIFPTKKAAKLESKRRNLITRFNAFRDECNDGWKPDWKDDDDRKHYIFFSPNAKLQHYSTGICRDFQPFGFFRNKEDVKLAIKLFGKEIIELFVECE